MVGNRVGFKVGDSVGELDGILVGNGVGTKVGDNVGEFDGNLVGNSVGEFVGDLDGISVGEDVGAFVGGIVSMSNVRDKPGLHCMPVLLDVRTQKFVHGIPPLHMSVVKISVWVIQLFAVRSLEKSKPRGTTVTISVPIFAPEPLISTGSSWSKLHILNL